MSCKNFHDYGKYAKVTLSIVENNRRARQNGTNNISLSNSVRWNDGEFRNKTASSGQIGSRCSFTDCGIISITDLKSKVNRLSKA